MGAEKQYLIMKDDYRRIILEEMHKMGAVETCIYCGVEYLTGKDESLIYSTITNIFKKKFNENYNNALMKETIKEILSERFYGHSCDK